MTSTLIVNARMVNEGREFEGDLRIEGDRIAQAMLIPVPVVTFEEVTELSDSERGEGGFGSSGR